MSTLREVIIEAIEDKKGENIVSIDLTSIDGSICDDFVICSAESTVQVSAIADGIEQATTEKLNDKPWRVQGKENALWVAMDYGNIMVHIFQTEMRDFYRLEDLWADAPITKYETKY